MKEKKDNRKFITGTVVSDKMDKTVTIQVETSRRHPLYKKFVKGCKKVKVHDENNEASEGDVVRVVETRHTSKDKFWRVVKILEKAQRSEQQ